MYTTSAIGPVFAIQALVKRNLVRSGGKFILISSEAGSITLRHESEGGGNYGHHASKAALNMVGKLLSLDLKDKGIAVGMVHPGFMRTEMTRGLASINTMNLEVVCVSFLLQAFRFWSCGG